ncbi:hypothetical protein TNCV_2543321 [Trichonephila clavipes]|nr:hypothetical protein TNCV_2543321 [Trichonephila clavipes]
MDIGNEPRSFESWSMMMTPEQEAPSPNFSITPTDWVRIPENRRNFLGIWTVKTVLNPISGQVFDAGHDESGVFHSA